MHDHGQIILLLWASASHLNYTATFLWNLNKIQVIKQAVHGIQLVNVCSLACFKTNRTFIFPKLCWVIQLVFFYSLYIYFIITVIPILLEYGSQSSLSVFLSKCLGPRYTNFSSENPTVCHIKFILFLAKTIESKRLQH